MGKDLDKRASRAPRPAKGTSLLPYIEKANKAVSKYLDPKGAEGQAIPNAALIYGVAAAALWAFAFYHLIVGQVVFAVLLVLLGVVMFAYAVFFIQSVGKTK